MKGTDYINATNLCKLRIAYNVLGDTLLLTEKKTAEKKVIMQTLQDWTDDLEKYFD